MSIQKDRPEPKVEIGRSVSIEMEYGVLVARRKVVNITEENKLQMSLSYVSGLSNEMSRAVVGMQLLDFILDWIKENGNDSN